MSTKIEAMLWGDIYIYRYTLRLYGKILKKISSKKRKLARIVLQMIKKYFRKFYSYSSTNIEKLNHSDIQSKINNVI